MFKIWFGVGARKNEIQMKKISILKLKKELDSYSVDETTKELIINNISMYNDLIGGYKSGGDENTYIIYQLGIQIHKQLSDVKKMAKVLGDDEDEFTKMVKSIKSKNYETR